MPLKINSTCFAADLTDCLNFKIMNELYEERKVLKFSSLNEESTS